MVERQTAVRRMYRRLVTLSRIKVGGGKRGRRHVRSKARYEQGELRTAACTPKLLCARKKAPPFGLWLSRPRGGRYPTAHVELLREPIRFSHKVPDRRARRQLHRPAAHGTGLERQFGGADREDLRLPDRYPE
eukprot:scaffold117543_cov80-Phaeocystis_antarctica.AAC.4